MVVSSEGRLVVDTSIYTRPAIEDLEFIPVHCNKPFLLFSLDSARVERLAMWKYTHQSLLRTSLTMNEVMIRWKVGCHRSHYSRTLVSSSSSSSVLICQAVFSRRRKGEYAAALAFLIPIGSSSLWLMKWCVTYFYILAHGVESLTYPLTGAAGRFCIDKNIDWAIYTSKGNERILYLMSSFVVWHAFLFGVDHVLRWAWYRTSEEIVYISIQIFLMITHTHTHTYVHINRLAINAQAKDAFDFSYETVKKRERKTDYWSSVQDAYSSFVFSRAIWQCEGTSTSLASSVLRCDLIFLKGLDTILNQGFEKPRRME